MKLRLWGAALSLLIAAPLFSQGRLRVEVPFRFHVGEAYFAPGTYDLLPRGDLPRTWAIYAREGAPAAFFFVLSGVGKEPAPEKGEVVFRVYGNHYFLSELRFGGRQSKWEVPVSPRERDLANCCQPTPASVERLASARPR